MAMYEKQTVNSFPHSARNRSNCKEKGTGYLSPFPCFGTAIATGAECTTAYSFHDIERLPDGRARLKPGTRVTGFEVRLRDGSIWRMQPYDVPDQRTFELLPQDFDECMK